MNNGATFRHPVFTKPAPCKGLQDFMQGSKRLSPAPCKGLQDFQGFFNLSQAREENTKEFTFSQGEKSMLPQPLQVLLSLAAVGVGGKTTLAQPLHNPCKGRGAVMTSKAIETHYNGYRFRSRLEARWAVFFDALRVDYEYEKQGYDLGEAGCYLPDFWLPAWQCWVEIKATPEHVTAHEKAKAWALARHTSALVFMFFRCDLPDIRIDDGMPTFPHYGRYYAPDGAWGGLMAFGVCCQCDRVTLGYHGGHYVHCAPAYDFQHCSTNALGDGVSDDPRIVQAFQYAKSARFEHGELGARPRTPDHPPETTGHPDDHVLPDHLRNHPDSRVRRRWFGIYRRCNELKARYRQDPMCSK